MLWRTRAISRPAAPLKLAGQNHLQRQGPRFRREERKALTLAVRFGSPALRAGEEQAAVRCGEEVGGFVRGGHRDVEGMRPEGALVKLGKVAHTGGETSANR